MSKQKVMFYISKNMKKAAIKTINKDLHIAVLDAETKDEDWDIDTINRIYSNLKEGRFASEFGILGTGSFSQEEVGKAIEGVANNETFKDFYVDVDYSISKNAWINGFCHTFLVELAKVTGKKELEEDSSFWGAQIEPIITKYATEPIMKIAEETV